MAKNRSVGLYYSTKVNGVWKYKPIPKKNLKNLTEGNFYLIYYAGTDSNGKARKRVENVGKLVDAAKVALTRKERDLLDRIVDGEPTVAGPVSVPQPAVASEPIPAPTIGAVPTSKPRTVKAAVNEFLENCEDRVGTSGYGFAKRSLIVYRRSLGYLIDFGGSTPLAGMDERFFRDYRRWLREHPNKFSDRSCHNILLTANTMARSLGNVAGKKVLAEMSFPPKPCLPYMDEELRKFFAVCSPQEALVFKFFLNSMGREQEVANTEVRDLDFSKNVLHFSPKVDRGFRLKSKKGSAALGRKVPIPASLMRQLEEHCKGKKFRDLVFPTAEGKVEGHFLRRCQKTAARAGMKEGWELHRFRKTGATKLHQAGAPVRQISAWLGHSDLQTTLIYLGVSDAADESTQVFVNSTPLAAMYA